MQVYTDGTEKNFTWPGLRLGDRLASAATVVNTQYKVILDMWRVDVTLLLLIIVTTPTAQAQCREVSDRKLPSTHTKELSIPMIDISGEADRQVIVAVGTPTDYRGQVNTALMADNKTMFATWSIGHDGKCGPLKKSVDGGLTWSDLIPTPKNWGEVASCPRIFRLTDTKGVERLFVFAGREEHHSSISNAGGITWKDYRKVCQVPGAVPCEPDRLCSPDGGQLACLMRENSRRFNSRVMFSDDEGETWSETRQLPASLTGDRHMPCHTNDGRLVVAFRDRAVGSSTYGQAHLPFA